MSDTNERSVASAGSAAGGGGIVERLRVFAVEAFALPVADLVDEAADEIDRLRDTVRRFCEPMPAISTLTDAERDAIERVIPGYEMAATNEGDPELAKIAATLRGLLKRTK